MTDVDARAGDGRGIVAARRIGVALDIGAAREVRVTRGFDRRVGAACGGRRGQRGGAHHLTVPFCQASARSRSANSRVMRPENSRAMTISAAYMLV